MSHAPKPAATDEPQTAPGPAFRFVHCADVHLDSPYRCASDDVRTQLHAAGRAAFVRLVDLCLDEHVHALLIAGDLFDDERLTFATEDFVAAQLTRLTQAGIHVVAVSGNHDHGGEAGRAARIAWPQERFTLIRDHEPEDVAITAPDGRVLARVIGCGHVDHDDGENLAALFPKASGSTPVIGLLHARLAEAAGAEHHPLVAPCTLADLAAPRYRYWALGHVHRRQELRAGNDAAATPLGCYAGTLIGHHAGETGAHGALLVSLPASGAPVIEFRELARVRWETLTLDGLPQIRDLPALRAAAVAAFLRVHAGGAPADTRWMLQLPLSGACEAAAELQREDLIDELSEQLSAELGRSHGVLSFEIVENGVHRPVDLSGHRGQPHVLGLSLQVVDALHADGDEGARDALLDACAPIVLAGCTGADAAARRDYLRSMLDGIDCAAGESLLKETHA